MVRFAAGSGHAGNATLWAGAFLLFLIVVLGPYVTPILMEALIAVMMIVALNTFQWTCCEYL